MSEPSQRAMGAPFRVCGSCAKGWACWRDFILDPDLRLLGLQLVLDLADGNLLVFDHCCGTSISVFVKRLRPLFTEIEDCDDPPDGTAQRSVSQPARASRTSWPVTAPAPGRVTGGWCR
jgi:hypothetical protein